MWSAKPKSDLQLYHELCNTEVISSFPFTTPQRQEMARSSGRPPVIMEFTPRQSAFLRYNRMHAGGTPGVIVRNRIAKRYAIPRKERVKHKDAWYYYNHNSRDWTSHVMMHNAVTENFHPNQRPMPAPMTQSPPEPYQEAEDDRKPPARPTATPRTNTGQPNIPPQDTPVTPTNSFAFNPNQETPRVKNTILRRSEDDEDDRKPPARPTATPPTNTGQLNIPPQDTPVTPTNSFARNPNQKTSTAKSSILRRSERIRLKPRPRSPGLFSESDCASVRTSSGMSHTGDSKLPAFPDLSDTEINDEDKKPPAITQASNTDDVNMEQGENDENVARASNTIAGSQPDTAKHN